MTAIEALPGVRELWRHTLGCPGVVLGVVEGPPDLTHPCFEGADLTVIEPSWLADTAVHPVAVEHGTFTTGMLFGQHHTSVPGLAPRCRGIIVPALRDQHSVLDALNAARAIDALAQAGADIIHFTAAHPTRSEGADPLLARAISAATDSGVLVVAPVGNDYGRNYAVPALLPEVLAVGAHQDDGTMFRYSNWGEPFQGHGIVAPGAALRGAAPGGATVIHQGTSIATPIVSGVAALLAGLQHRHRARVDTRVVRDALLRSARPCSPAQAHADPTRCLSGRLDVPGAIRFVLHPATQVSTPP